VTILITPAGGRWELRRAESSSNDAEPARSAWLRAPVCCCARRYLLRPLALARAVVSSTCRHPAASGFDARLRSPDESSSRLLEGEVAGNCVMRSRRCDTQQGQLCTESISWPLTARPMATRLWLRCSVSMQGDERNQVWQFRRPDRSAREMNADLIVLGHRDQESRARGLNGSVGESILHHQPCRLLVAVKSRTINSNVTPIREDAGGVRRVLC
jgi:hypothetical protein